MVNENTSLTKFEFINGDLILHIRGTWSISQKETVFPDLEEKFLKFSGAKSLSFSLRELKAWDTSLVSFINSVIRSASEHGIEVNLNTLPNELNEIIKLALAVPPKQNTDEVKNANILAKFGEYSIKTFKGFNEILAFTGSIVLTFFRMLTGKNRFRASETFSIIQQCGPEALPIVTLISVLIGLILAYIGAVQLKQFGATIYVANLVGIAMLREMGAIMAAIVMAGRTGAAFAAQLGTMEVNEEIDAFKTLGISPNEMLVLPRMLALILMMPLLCLYADILGILGGAGVGIFSLDLEPALFFKQLQGSIHLNDLFVGIVKSIVFGILIASAGCLKGIKCARSASAVGEAVTGAVVSSIVAIVATDAVFAVITNILGV